MITKAQQKWLEHLSTEDKINIKPYDPKSQEIFAEVEKKVTDKIGKVEVLHRGASYFKISGQDEIDIYIPITPSSFNKIVKKMTKSFGEPKSLYPLVRARFPISGYGKHIDVFVINKKDEGWVNSEIFTNWLLTHPETLSEYRELKENGLGLSTKEYYTQKIKFINGIMKKAEKKTNNF